MSDDPDDKVVVTIGKDGVPSVQVKNIKSIAIENIIDVTGHRIMRDEEGVVHEITFADGGTASISYTYAGVLRAFEGNHIGSQVTADGAITLRKFDG